MNTDEKIDQLRNMVQKLKKYVNAYNTDMIVDNLNKIDEKLFWLRESIR